MLLAFGPIPGPIRSRFQVYFLRVISWTDRDVFQSSSLWKGMRKWAGTPAARICSRTPMSSSAVIEKTDSPCPLTVAASPAGSVRAPAHILGNECYLSSYPRNGVNPCSRRRALFKVRLWGNVLLAAAPVEAVGCATRFGGSAPHLALDNTTR
jgi:hypothetical protein